MEMDLDFGAYIVFLVPDLNSDFSGNSVIFSWSSLQREPLIDGVVVDEFWSKFCESQETLFFDRTVVNLQD